MSGSGDHGSSRWFTFDALATVVLDEEGTVRRWSPTAVELVGHTATDVLNRPVRELVVAVSGAASAPPLPGTAVPAGGQARLRHRRGGTVDVTFRVFRLEGTAELLVLAAPAHHVSEQELAVSLLRALLSQEGIAVTIHGPDLAIERTNVVPSMFGESAASPGSRLRDLLVAEDADDLEESLRQVLETGVSLVGVEKRLRPTQVPGNDWMLKVCAVRLEDAAARPAGVAVLSTETSEQRRTRHHLNILREAAIGVGDSLDVERTAQQLAEAVCPALGDLGIVDLAHAVLGGDEPPRWSGGGDLDLRAVASATGEWPGRVRRGERIPPLPDSPALRSLQRGKTLAMTREQVLAGLADPDLQDLLLPDTWHAILVAPLFARGLILGDLQVWRVKESAPFTREDIELVTEIASRGALAIDNARRYTREHRAAVALQQRLLPRATTDTAAAETVGIYQPASGGAEIGGDWFDAITLPSLRLALVVGDVAGHGLHAAAGMGRLRAAIHTLADQELEPDELLTRLDGVVQRLANEAAHRHPRDTVAATCLYAAYDPVSRQCILASAGHPAPVVVRPDGTHQDVPLSPGPPLGVGGMPFETTTVTLEPGSVIALYTKGLVLRQGGDPDVGARRLADGLAAHCRLGSPLDEVSRAVLPEAGEDSRGGDVVLLVARTRALPEEDTVRWEFPGEPAVVADAREKVVRQLSEWGLDDLAFTTELVVSELVTNAVRHAGGPVGLRLIRDKVLICEVTDPSNTQPRLRRARTTDEGGRGLFLVAQLSTRWGCRYGQTGKTIWAEQSLTPTMDLGMWKAPDVAL